MSDFFAGVRTMIGLELRQRVRGIAWYVLLSIFFVVLLIVTALAVMASGFAGPSGGLVYSVVAYVVLLIATLVTPAISGGAINGDRDAATLAPIQVTLLSTGQIVIGKFLAAWLTGLSFLVVAVPFMIFAAIVGASSSEMAWRTAVYSAGSEATGSTNVGPLTVICSLAVLIVEVGVVAAVGVGLSGVIARPVLSVVTAYLVIAALSIGTLIAFGLGGAAIASTATTSSRINEYDPQTGLPTTDPPTCQEWEVNQYRAPRFDLVWGFLAANPYVIMADATPITFDQRGNPVDLFGQISAGVRLAQKPPILERTYDECSQTPVGEPFVPVRDQIEGAVPSWFVGLGIQLLLAGGALWWGIARTNTPARRLPRGTRIA